ncbi:MAG: UbiA family prenyltransferase [Bacteroidales bacterium]|nr:UbiA family prenyltransferase [Bacteroidales bacterium]
MKTYLRLVRLPNLMMIAFTMYAMRFLIVRPQLLLYGMDLQFSEAHFALLVVSVLFITAAGYVINDYFDAPVDMINRPSRVMLSRLIPRRMAIVVHLTLSIIGVAAGIYLSFAIRLSFLSMIFLLVPGILWFYSTTYKRQFLLGNLIVAFLTALVPLMVILFEVPLLIREYGREMVRNQIDFHTLTAWVGGYALFAFLFTLIREIVKDMEDFEGDRAYGRNTLPVVLGLKTTRYVVLALTGVAVVFIAAVLVLYLTDLMTLLYTVLLVMAPLAFAVFRLLRASTAEQYHQVSSWLKGIMLAGVGYSFLAWYIMTYTIH